MGRKTPKRGSKTPQHTSRILRSNTVATKNEKADAIALAKAEKKETTIRDLRRHLDHVNESVNFLTKQLDNPQASRGMIETALRKITKFDDEYEKVYSKLEELETDDDESETAAERTQSETVIHNLESRYRDRLYTLQDAMKPPPPFMYNDDDDEVNVHNAQQVNNSNAIPFMMMPKLPRIPDLTLPTFDGTEREWIPYKKFMEDVFVTRSDLPDVYKYQYLKGSCVGGKAKEIVLSVKNSSFQTAWDNLKRHYDNDVLLKYLVLDELYNASVTKDGDVKSLEEFVNTVDRNVNYFASIGVDTKKWDLFLGLHFMQRLDRVSQIEFEKIRNADEVITVDMILRFVKQRIRVLTVCKANSKPGIKSTFNDEKKQFPARQSSFKVTNENLNRCGFCDQNHSVLTCPTLKDLTTNEIKLKARELNLCFNCFQPNHGVNDCTETKGCSKCGSFYHHTILHSTNYGTTFTATHDSQHDLNETRDESLELSAPAIHHDDEMVFLPTATVYAQSNDGSFVQCRSLLDSGSTCNIISTQLAKRLKLPTTRTKVKIKGFNGNEIVVKRKMTATIHSSFNDYGDTVDFYIMKKITSDVPSRVIQISDLNLPLGCQLSDQRFNQPNSIDVVFGIDVFSNVLKAQKYELENGLRLRESEFGYLVTGKIHPNSSHQIEYNEARLVISKLHDDPKFGEMIKYTPSNQRYVSNHSESSTKLVSQFSIQNFPSTKWFDLNNPHHNDKKTNSDLIKRPISSRRMNEESINPILMYCTTFDVEILFRIVKDTINLKHVYCLLMKRNTMYYKSADQTDHMPVPSLMNSYPQVNNQVKSKIISSILNWKESDDNSTEIQLENYQNAHEVSVNQVMSNVITEVIAKYQINKAEIQQRFTPNSFNAMYLICYGGRFRDDFCS